MAVAERRRTMRSHASTDERVAAGRAARSAVPRASHADWAPAADRRDPVDMLEEQAATRVPELVPDPLRADARLAVHVLPRRRLPHGRRPRGGPADEPRGPALRRRAPVELRRVRRARPPPGLQHQRLRRDAAGAVRVGREAARGELRGRGPRPRLRRPPARARSTARRHVRTATRCASSPAMRTLDVWYARLDVDELAAAHAGGRHAQADRERSRPTSPRRAARQPARVRQADASWSTASRGS